MKNKKAALSAVRCGRKFFSTVFLVTVFCFNLGAPVWAAEDIRITIGGGFDGKFKLGGVNPVNISLEASATGGKGMLVMETDGRTYSHEAEITPNSKKDFVFPVLFLKADSQILVRYEDGGKVLSSAQFTPDILPGDSVFIGILSDSPQSLAYAAAVRPDTLGSKKIHVVKLEKNLAYSLEELENFNFILVGNFNGADLPGESRKKLESWLGRGNCMLVGTGQYAYKNLKGWFENLDSPQSMGEGRIVPVREGLENKTPEFLEGLLVKYITSSGISKITEDSSLSRQIQAAGKLYPAADAGLRPTLNALFFLLSLLVLYLAGLGISLWAHKKLGWLFSAAVAGFCGIFYIAALWGGVQDTSAAAAIVKIYGGKVAGTYALAGVYPRGGEGLSLKLPGAAFLYNWGESPKAVDPVEQEAFFSGTGPYYAYSSSMESSGTSGFLLDLEEGEVLKGKIKNPLPYKLRKCFVVIGDTVIEVGDLEGKEEIQLEYRLDHTLRELSEYNYLSAVFKSGKMEGWEKLLFEHYYYTVNDAGGGRLFGFSEDTAEVGINGKRQNIKAGVLHIFQAGLRTGNGKAHLPCGYIQPVPEPGENAAPAGRREFLLEQGKELKLHYVLPQNFRAEEIKLYNMPQPGTLEIYNRKKASWSQLAGDSLTGDALEEYISGGPLLIRIKDGSRVILPQISVEGVYRAGGENGREGESYDEGL